MPLSPAGPREEQHVRQIELRGFRRLNGLYDVEARLVDTKPYVLDAHGGRIVPPGEPIHDMAIRLVIDDTLLVIDVEASIDAAPHSPCVRAVEAMASLKGLRIGKGWNQAVRERLSGALGCTHLMELLAPLATVAVQTLGQVRHARPTPLDATGKPSKIDSCYAYAANREVVQRLWPDFSSANGANRKVDRP